MIDYAKLAGAELMTLSPYLPGKPMKEVQRESGIKDVIKLASNENPYGPSPKVFEALKEFLPDAARYPLGDCYYLRGSIAKMFSVDMDNILCGAGSDEIIQLLYLAFLTEGTNVVAPSPSFAEYYILAKSIRAECRWVKTGADFTIDFDAVLAAIDKNTRFVMLANPNNPTGLAFTEHELIAFLDKAPSDVMVVMDEAYVEFADIADMPDSVKLMKKYKNLMTMRTFSKVYGLASMRCGFIIAHKECIDVLQRVRPPFNVSQAAQVMADAALSDTKHLQYIIDSNAKGREYLYKSFEKLQLKYIKTQANFMLVNVKDGKRVFGDLLKEGVIVRFLGDPQLKEYIRVSVGTDKENEIFIEKLSKVL